MLTLMVRARRALLLLAVLAIPVTAAAVAPGEAAPAISASDLTGSKIDLAALRGKVVLVDFWASWCAPCREELPWLEQLHKRHAAAGLTVIGVNLDESSANAQKFLRSHPVTFPVVHDTQGRLADRYGPSKMPSSYLIDATGRVRFVHGGFRAADGAAIEAEVVRLLAESKGKG